MEQRRRGPLFVAVTLGLLVGAVVNDRLLASGRALHVVNGFDREVVVALEPGDREVSVPPGGRVEVELAEGAYRARPRLEDGAPLEEVPFEVGGDGVVARWLDRTAFVLMPGGAAALAVEEAIYGPKAPPPSPGQLLAGQGFVAVTGLDLQFAAFPDEDAAGHKRRVTQLTGPPAVVLARLWPEARATEGAMRYAETHLRATPEDDDLLEAYLRLIEATSGTERARRVRAYLSAGLEGPAAHERLAWHRAYQDLTRALGEEEALRAEYAARLEAAADAPAHEQAVLHYLRGRIAAEVDAARAAYETALARDPSFGQAHYALAVVALREARFEGGLEHALAACAARPGDAAAESVRDELRLALGQTEPLRAQLDAAAAEGRLDFAGHLRHLAALVADGDAAAAREAQQAFRQRVESRGDDRHQLVLLAELRLRYLTGDLTGLLERTEAVRDEGRRQRLRFETLLELERPAEAAALLPDGPGAGPFALLVSLTHARVGEGREAATWRARAALDLGRGDRGERAAAAVLKGEAPATPEAVRSLDLPPPVKATLLLALAAEAAPEARPALVSLAQRYAFRPGFPRRWLTQTAEWLRNR